MGDVALSKKDAKKAENEKFLAHAKVVLDEAHKAAAVAAENFINTAKRTPEGYIADVCGGASVIVFKPSYKLRETLKSLGEIEKGHNGAWHISNFWKHVRLRALRRMRRHVRLHVRY